MYAANTELKVTYPESTQVESQCDYRTRRIRIRDVRDLISDPLTPEEYFRRPLTRRSRFLVTAFDLDLNQWRRFYLGSTQEHASEGRLRWALYQPGHLQPKTISSRSFDPTRRDRIALANVIRQLQQRPDDGLELRIIPDEVDVLKLTGEKPF